MLSQLIGIKRPSYSELLLRILTSNGVRSLAGLFLSILMALDSIQVRECLSECRLVIPAVYGREDVLISHQGSFYVLDFLGAV